MAWCGMASAQIWTEDFESGTGSINSNSGVYCNSGSDYLTVDTDANLSGNFTGNATNFLAAQDIDGCAGNTAEETLTWTGININGCTGLSLSVDLAEDDDGANEDWDSPDFMHIEVNIDGGGWVPVIWVENDGSGTNSPPYIDTDYNGTGDGTEITDTWQTFTQAIAGTGTVMDIRIVIHLDSEDEDIAIDNLEIDGTGCGGCPGLATEPTIDISGNTATPACTSADIDWTNGNNSNVIVVFSTSPITWTPTDGVDYNVGDTPAAGVTVIYDGSGNSVGVTGLTAGTTYYYAVFGYNGSINNCEENFLVGGQTGSFITISGCDPSYIQSINYNSCSSAEGTDEIIFVQIGNTDVNVDDIIIDLPNSTWCNSGCGSNTIVNNQAHLDALNALAGCSPDLFVYCDPIPAGSALMIFTGNPPSVVLDYSSNCSGQQYCAIFLDNSSTIGNFSNSSSAPRTTTINFGNGDVSTATYTATDGPCDCDGATANFDVNGNITNYVQNTDCIYPLALNIRTLSGHVNGNSNVIQWTTNGDNKSSYFEVESSETGEDWKLVETVNAERETNFGNFYEVTDNTYIKTGSTYYRLIMFDGSGKRVPSNIISIERDAISTYLKENKLTVGFNQHPNKSYTLNIYDVAGSLIHSEPAENGMTIDWSYKGLFIVEIPEIEARQKLISQ